MARMKRRFFGIAANAGLSTTFNIGYVFALAFGAYRLLNGLDYGTVTAMLQLVNQIQAVCFFVRYYAQVFLPSLLLRSG